MEQVEESFNPSPPIDNEWIGLESNEETPLEYESDPELWSYSDETSLTGPEERDYPQTLEQKITRQERLRMIALRKHLDQLSEKILEKDYVVEKTREELKRCRERVQGLGAQQDQLMEEMERCEAAGSMALLYRLQSRQQRLGKELAAEENLEQQITHSLEDAELELAQAQVEQGKFLLIEEELRPDEERWEREKTEAANQRLRKENLRVLQVEKRRRNKERDNIAATRERDRKHRQAMTAARRNREAAAKYLKETLAKVREKESEEEEKQRAHLDQRVKTLMSLKKDITTSKENMKAIQARNKHEVQQMVAAEVVEKEEVAATGANADVAMIQKKKLQKIERDREVFEASERVGQVEIAERILYEEKQMKKRMAQYPQLFPDPRRERSKRVVPHRKHRKPPPPRTHLIESGSSSMEYSADIEEIAVSKVSRGLDSTKLTTVSSDDEGEFSPFGISHRDERDLSSEDHEHNLAQPEFAGLWEQQDHKSYKVPKDGDLKYMMNYSTKMEQEIMMRALDKHKLGIIKKQVAAGREFKGSAFYSKPDLIHFKDFDVGKTYKKKVLLTNVSYSVNFLKLMGISEHLKDFISILFDPPGQMSAGLTCEMLVTFKPMINEDLEGEVSFLAQTGPFTVPVKCSTKKCDLSVDTEVIDFGTQVIGETLRKTITLTNQGAMATNYEFLKVMGTRPQTTTDSADAVTFIGAMTGGEPEPHTQDDLSAGEDRESKPQADSTGPDPGETKETIIEEDEEDKEKEKKLVESGEGGGRGEEGMEGERTTTSKSTKMLEHSLIDSEGVGSFAIGLNELEDVANFDGIHVGNLVGGEIPPFSSVKLEVIFAPTIPGKVDTDLEIRFTDPLSVPIGVKAVASAIDVPVWVERHNVDLKVCMFERLYQDSIVVNNRATTALRLKFEVPKELRNHLELLPKTGYIQAQSKFTAQLKFFPRFSLIEEGGKYYDKETGVIEAPMTIRVADQTTPVNFTLHSVVTSSDMEFDVNQIDFGYCTIYESVVVTVRLTNKSILPQKFGFVSLPDYVDVQPNDGFGTLLPLETLELDIIFSAKKAKEYTFELNCKSGINRDFMIQCKAVGVHPPLELSHSTMHFAATALDDSSVASFSIINSHTSSNEFTHPVPRIGKGDIVPVGPMSFEFVVPEGIPINISPKVGTVLTGKKSHLTVKFSPSLEDSVIRDETVRTLTRQMEAIAKRELQEAQRAAKKSAEGPADKKKGGGGGKKAKSPVGAKKTAAPKSQSPSAATPKPLEPPTPQSIDPSSNEYAAAKGSLMRSFKGSFQTYTIPCFVTSGVPGDPGTLPYSVHNTLYLEVHCPTVRPSLVAISNHGRALADFGPVSIGQKLIRPITIQNISNKFLDLKSSVLDTAGPFLLLNAMRPLPPGGSHTLLVSFTPSQGKVYYQVLEVQSSASTLSITLQGGGVIPKVDVTVKDNLLDMGYVLAGEEHSETFMIENTSSLAVDYNIKLDSLSLRKHIEQQGLPGFIAAANEGDPNMAAGLLGPANYAGSSVFDFVPAEGSIEPGGNQEITVTFSPDHPSDFYSDRCKIELYGQEAAHVFQVKGVSKEHTMYLTGGDRLTTSIESLMPMPLAKEEEEEAKVEMPAVPILLTFHSVSGGEDSQQTSLEPCSREIQVGCIRTTAVSQKKNGEFSFDNVNIIATKGFQIDNQKGMIEAGMTKSVNFTWSPPPGHDPNTVVEASCLLNLKGDVSEKYNILLRAMVVSVPQP